MALERPGVRMEDGDRPGVMNWDGDKGWCVLEMGHTWAIIRLGIGWDC